MKTKWITDILLDAAKENLISSFYEFEQTLNSIVNFGLWIKKSYLDLTLNKAKKYF